MRDGLARRGVPRAQLLLVVVMLGLAVAPHLANLSPWITAVFYLMALWRLAAAAGDDSHLIMLTGEAGSGKTALVTGASQGIGEAVAKTLAERGARVMAVARSEAELKAATAAPEEGGMPPLFWVIIVAAAIGAVGALFLMSRELVRAAIAKALFVFMVVVAALDVVWVAWIREEDVAGLGWPFWAALPCGALAAGIAGLLFGLPSLKIKGFYLIMATIAAQFIIIWIICFNPIRVFNKHISNYFIVNT